QWQRIAELEGSMPSRCRVVESHYYRGRISAREAQDRNLLYSERVFDDGLLYAGVEPHYRPVSNGKELGVDVLLALEVYHMTVTKGLDVCVLFAGDGDFIPLVRKLHGLGTRVMVLGFNVQAMGHDGNPSATRCSFHLMQEASYPVELSQEIADEIPGDNPLLDGLFQPRTESPDGGISVGKLAPAPPVKPLQGKPSYSPEMHVAPPEETDGGAMRWSGHICYLQDSFGFLLREGDNKRFFFHKSDLQNLEYHSLKDGQEVSFLASENDRGPCAKRIFSGA
ncbi:MAG: cold shock domain-containing protein, partial [Planctomycetota bacterium]